MARLASPRSTIVAILRELRAPIAAHLALDALRNGACSLIPALTGVLVDRVLVRRTASLGGAATRYAVLWRCSSWPPTPRACAGGA